MIYVPEQQLFVEEKPPATEVEQKAENSVISEMFYKDSQSGDKEIDSANFQATLDNNFEQQVETEQQVFVEEKPQPIIENQKIDQDRSYNFSLKNRKKK